MKFDDGISHDLQDRIDTVMDILRNIRKESKDWSEFQCRKKDKTTLYRLKLIVDTLEEIRDDIPCTCGEEESK